MTGSDGSVKDNKAIYAYVIIQKRKLKWIWGHGYVNGTANLLTSLRAEHNGTIAVLIILHMLIKRWNLTKDTPPVIILVHNKEGITSTHDGLPSLSIYGLMHCTLFPFTYQMAMAQSTSRW